LDPGLEGFLLLVDGNDVVGGTYVGGRCVGRRFGGTGGSGTITGGPIKIGGVGSIGKVFTGLRVVNGAGLGVVYNCDGYVEVN
jgi:hypothetical protein